MEVYVVNRLRRSLNFHSVYNFAETLAVFLHEGDVINFLNTYKKDERDRFVVEVLVEGMPNTVGLASDGLKSAIEACNNR